MTPIQREIVIWLCSTDFPHELTRVNRSCHDFIAMPAGKLLGEQHIPLVRRKSLRFIDYSNNRDCSTYEFTLTVQLGRVVLAPVRRVLKSCEIKAGTRHRYAAYAAGRAGVDNSRLVFGSGTLEERRQEQLCEVEMTCFAEGAQNGCPFISNRGFLTESIGTPGHVIPVSSKFLHRRPHNTTVLEGRFNSTFEARERNARVVEKDVEF